jgi:hypothetical protein
VNIGKIVHTTTLPELLADVTELVNVASARAHWQSSIDMGTTIVWVFGHVVGVSMDGIVYWWDFD